MNAPPSGADVRWSGTLGRTLAVTLAALVVHGLVQAWLPHPIDRDAWFHARLARLMASGDAAWNGLTFPWLTHSAFADLPMDWAWLWHAALAPFTVAFGAMAGLHVFAVVQASLLTGAFHLTLEQARVKGAVAWTALLVLGAPEWLFRLHFGRPTPLLIATLLLVLTLALRGRNRSAGVVATLSLLVYQVPAPLALVAGAAVLARWVAERRFPTRTFAWLLAGGIAGLLLHPGAWSSGDGPLDVATLHVWALMAGSLAAAAQGGEVVLTSGETLVLPLPQELGAPGARELLGRLWLSLAATVATLALLPRRLREPAAVAGAVLALVGLAGTLRSGRFFEYWHVFALLGAAATVSAPSARGSARPHAQLVGLVVVVLGGLTVRALDVLIEKVGVDPGSAVAPAMRAVASRAAPGDIVWHASWDDFAPLFHFAPELRYITGMDPWWLVAHDPDDAAAFARLGAGLVPAAELRTELTGRFGARHVVLWNRPDREGRIAPMYPALESALRDADWADVVHEDEATVAFTLRAADSDASGD